MINEIRLWLGKPKALFFTLPMLLLLFTVACGSAAAPETVVVETEVVREVPVDREVVREVPIDREVVREVVKEVPVDREVVREVPVEKIVDRDVVREIPVEKIVVVTPVIATAPKNVIPVGTLNVAMAGLGPFTGHPMLASGTATDVLSTAVAEALWQYDIDRRAIPMLVKSWSISDDFTTWTLNLQEGVQFHKGYGEFTAEDVSWSLGQRILNPKATNVAQLKWAWQTSVDMPDAYTMVVNTGDPMPGWAFVDLVRNPGDQYVVSKKQTEEIGAEAANRNIAATGPWEIAEHRSGEFWRMRAVEDHWRKTPHFEEMVFWEIPEEATRLAGFQTGKLDTFPMGYDSISLVTQVPDAKVMRIPKAAVMNLRIYGQDYAEIGTPDQRASYDPELPWASANTDVNSPEWEQSAKVRRALMLAIDMDTIIETLLHGFADASSVGFYGVHRHLLDEDMYWGYDLEEAKRLLAEAGYPGGGFSLTLTPAKRGAPSEVEVCEAIGAMWGEIGIDVKFQNVPFSTVRPGIVGRTYQGVTCHAGTPPPTPARSFYGLSIKSAIYGITHPWLEDIVYRAYEEVDPTERENLERQVARFLYDGAHLRELYIYDAVWPVGPRIEEWSEGVTFGDLRFQSGFEWIRHRE
jgi:peptide/nickel transport system substrate-binding protein